MLTPTYEIGPHRLYLGDLRDGAVRSALAAHKPEVVYGEPPFDEENLRKYTDRSNWRECLEAFVALCVECDPYEVGILVGFEKSDEIGDLFAEAGFVEKQRWSVTGVAGELVRYVPKRRSRVVNWPEAIEPSAGLRVTFFLSQARRSRVLDPVIGRGATAVQADALGYEVVGCEIESVALAACKAQIERWREKRGEG